MKIYIYIYWYGIYDFPWINSNFKCTFSLWVFLFRFISRWTSKSFYACLHILISIGLQLQFNLNKVGLNLNIIPKCIHGPIVGPIGCPWSEIWLNMNHLEIIAILGYVAYLGYIKCISDIIFEHTHLSRTLWSVTP